MELQSQVGIELTGALVIQGADNTVLFSSSTNGAEKWNSIYIIKGALKGKSMKKITIILVLAISVLSLCIYMDISDTYNVLPFAVLIVWGMFIFLGISDLGDTRKIRSFIHFILSAITFITFIYLIV